MIELTPKERQVLQELLAGRANKEIAWSMGTTEATIKKYVSNVYQKLGITSSRQLFPMIDEIRNHLLL